MAESVEAAMLQMLENNTDRVKDAEAFLQSFLKDAAAPAVLLQLATASENEFVRQMAALFAVRKIWKYFKNLPAAEQEGKKLIKRDAWAKLPGFVMQCVLSESGATRELGVLVFTALLKSMGLTLLPEGDIQQMIMSALADAEAPVRTAGLKGLGALTKHIDEATAQFVKPMLPVVINALRQCAANYDELEIVSAFDVLQDIISIAPSILTPHVADMLTFFGEIINNDSMESWTRDQAVDILRVLIESRPKAVATSGALPQLLNMVVRLIALYDEEEETAAREAGELDYTMPNIAGRLADAMAIHLPAKHFYKPCVDVSLSMLQQEDWHLRYAGVTMFGLIAEGCDTTVRAHLTDILSVVLPTHEDPHHSVRRQTAWTLSHFAQHLVPQILRYHEEVLPVVLRLLQDPQPRVVESSCYVIDCFCDEMSADNLRPFLSPLMNRLGGLLGTDDVKVQEMVLSAVGSIAVAAKAEFTPFLPSVADTLRQIVELNDDHLLQLRGRALDAFGNIAAAVGVDAIAPYQDQMIAAAVDSFKFDNTELKEHALLMFGNLSEVMGERMAPMMETLMELINTNCNILDGVTVGQDPTADNIASRVAEFGDDGDDDEGADEGEPDSDDEDGGGNGAVPLRVREAIMDLKSTAILCLGKLCKHTGAAFEPHMESALALMEDLMFYFHEEVRQNVISTTTILISQLMERTPGVGQGMAIAAAEAAAASGQSRTAVPLHESIADKVYEFVGTFADLAEYGEDREGTARVLEGFVDWLNVAGIAVINPVLERLVNVVYTLFEERAPCQHFEDDMDEEEEGGDTTALLDSTAELLAAIGRAMRDEYKPVWEHCLDAIMKFTKPSRPYNERAMAIGTFSDSAQVLGEAFIDFAPRLLPIVLKGFKDEMESVRRNCAFTTGAIIAAVRGKLPDTMIMSALEGLQPLFVIRDKEDGSVRDNAVSAMARILQECSDRVPVPAVLDAILAHVPLVADHNEDEAVYGCLASMLAVGHPEALARLPQILHAFCQALGDDSGVPDSVRNSIVESLKDFMGKAAGPFHDACGKLSEADQAGLRMLLQ